jgi:hypothetical protein
MSVTCQKVTRNTGPNGISVGLDSRATAAAIFACMRLSLVVVRAAELPRSAELRDRQNGDIDNKPLSPFRLLHRRRPSPPRPVDVRKFGMPKLMRQQHGGRGGDRGLGQPEKSSARRLNEGGYLSAYPAYLRHLGRRRARSPLVLLDADYVGRSIPAIPAAPWRARKQIAIFFSRRDLAHELRRIPCISARGASAPPLSPLPPIL